MSRPVRRRRSDRSSHAICPALAVTGAQGDLRPRWDNLEKQHRRGWEEQGLRHNGALPQYVRDMVSRAKVWVHEVFKAYAFWLGLAWVSWGGLGAGRWIVPAKVLCEDAACP